MFIYLIGLLYFGFNAWCFLMAWNRPNVFEGYMVRLDRSLDRRDFIWILFSAALLLQALSDVVFSWYQQ